MKRTLYFIALSCAALAIQACGGNEESRVPTDEENRKLDDISRQLDNQQTIDTSPDSLTAGEPPVANETLPPEEVENSAAADLANAQ